MDEKSLTDPSNRSIKAFCARSDISKTSYYELKKKGLGPDELHAGGCIRITPRAEAAWVKACERPTGTEARLLKRAAEHRVRIARKTKKPRKAADKKSQPKKTRSKELVPAGPAAPNLRSFVERKK
jgi:hypothetical protein